MQYFRFFHIKSGILTLFQVFGSMGLVVTILETVQILLNYAEFLGIHLGSGL